MARYLCNHAGTEIQATYFLRAISTRKWHGKEALDPQVDDKAYACCDAHVTLALRYLLEKTDGTAIVKVSKVKPNPPRDV